MESPAAGSSFKLEQVPVRGHTGTKNIHNSPKSEQRCQSKQQHAESIPNHLPNRLVGSRSLAEVKIGELSHGCLIDSGSQVTTISKSFQLTHLPSHPLLPLNDLLEVEGAAGQIVPYLGYIEVDITFPQSFTGKDKVVTILALIVPDHRANSEIPVLIGTNALDVLYEDFNEQMTIPEHCAYAPLIRHLHAIYRSKTKTDSFVGTVKSQCKTNLVIPAGQKIALNGRVRNVCAGPGSTLLVEPHSQSSLPGGLIFSSYVMSKPRQTSFKVPILLKNETTHDIILPAHRPLAAISIPLSVSPARSECMNRTGSSEQKHAQCYTTHEVQPSDKIQFDFGDSPLSNEWKDRIAEKLNSVSDVFARGELDYGHTTVVRHKIRLSDPTPFKQRPRPIHPSDYEAVRLHLEQLCNSNIIRESESPFASPIVVVKKKNGQIRLCVDYRKLNNQTIKDAYALPNIEEAFTALSGSKWFSVMDLKSGYYQVEVEEEDKHKTAFVTPMGFWEFNRMPQGVTNAPSTFQRVMEKCMGSMNLKEVLVFLDDLIVFSNTLEEHEERLLRVLNRLKEFGLKLSPEKCHFFQKSVRYLGHIVSEQGVKTDPDKISALTTWPRPTNLSELKSFLGFTGYYRRFVKDYSKIARPLNDLTAGYVPARKLKHHKSPSNGDLNRPFNEKWTPSCEEAFTTLIEKLTSAPVLGFADPRKAYVLHTDASSHGLGAALYQEEDGRLRVIAYASRGLSNCERRYPTHKLEFLALKWAVTDKFADYLYGADFTVMTDNNPLTYVLTSAKLDATGHRWLAALSNFNFNIQYRAGKRNQDADGLSRRPHVSVETDDSTTAEDERVKQFIAKFTEEGNSATFPKDALKAVCEKHQVHISPDTTYHYCHYLPAAVECLAVDASAIPDEFVQADILTGTSTLPQLSQQDWAAEQRRDPIISRVIDLVHTGKRLSYRLRQKEEREVQLMLRVQDQLSLIDNVLYRKRVSQGQTLFQLVLPKEYREVALESLHDAVGHMGLERTVDLVRTRFFWPRMFLDVEMKIRTCERCIRRKARAEKSAPLVNIKTSRPLELVCMDYLSLEPDSRGTKNILVITDHFTKFAVAVPTPDQKEKTVAKALWDKFIIHYGIPERLHSDQGRNFESAVIKNLCQMLGIKKSRTTPYHPRGNPVERFNRTLLGMLGTLQEDDKLKWRDHVQPLAHAYNCTKNDTTGYSPYQLMFGRQPNLPIDVAFGLNVSRQDSVTHSEYVKKLRESLQESYKLAVEHSEKAALRNKSRYDLKVRESTLEVGDRVLVKNVGIRGKHKLADRWSQTVYKVVKQLNDSPVYVVAPLKSDGPERTLHRDLLLPCGFLSCSAPIEPSHGSQEKETPKGDTSKENPFSEVEGDYHYLGDNDIVDYDFPVVYEEVNYPAFITVSEIPKATESVSEQSVDRDESDLNPAVKEFHSAPVELDEGDGSLQGSSGNDIGNDPPMKETGVIVNEEYSSVHDSCADIDPATENDVEPLEEVIDVTQEQYQTETTGLSDGKEGSDRYGLEAEVAKDEKPPETREIRRSTRNRTEPSRLTYNTLGNPLTLVMHSLLNSLDQVFSHALGSNPSPCVGRVKTI
ncbi:retrovirus-related Pol polyprotein from transposon opus [Maylandia zebra]|uniref:retrovirus-related Pol polyprotein from transposon opus n=1 Tax=Maylandia zebra TaxID=106582 RepID=UPI00403C6CDE